VPAGVPDDTGVVAVVEEAISQLQAEFLREPTRFFTENDLVCRLHRSVSERLEGAGLATARDRNGLPHGLVHCEYPTPFRCDMGGLGFRRAGDAERTGNGGLFGRGHYDVVVMHPDAIGRHGYEAIKGQNYSLLLDTVLPTLTEARPLISYGIELAFSRAAIRPFAGSGETGVPRFVAEVIQDAQKLAASVGDRRFMRRAAMLAFVYGTPPQVVEDFRAALAHLPLVRLIARD